MSTRRTLWRRIAVSFQLSSATTLGGISSPGAGVHALPRCSSGRCRGAALRAVDFHAPTFMRSSVAAVEQWRGRALYLDSAQFMVGTSARWLRRSNVVALETRSARLPTLHRPAPALSPSSVSALVRSNVVAPERWRRERSAYQRFTVLFAAPALKPSSVSALARSNVVAPERWRRERSAYQRFTVLFAAPALKPSSVSALARSNVVAPERWRRERSVYQRFTVLFAAPALRTSGVPASLRCNVVALEL